MATPNYTVQRHLSIQQIFALLQDPATDPNIIAATLYNLYPDFTEFMPATTEMPLDRHLLITRLLIRIWQQLSLANVDSPNNDIIQFYAIANAEHLTQVNAQYNYLQFLYNQRYEHIKQNFILQNTRESLLSPQSIAVLRQCFAWQAQQPHSYATVCATIQLGCRILLAKLLLMLQDNLITLPNPPFEEHIVCLQEMLENFAAHQDTYQDSFDQLDAQNFCAICIAADEIPLFIAIVDLGVKAVGNVWFSHLLVDYMLTGDLDAVAVLEMLTTPTVSDFTITNRVTRRIADAAPSVPRPIGLLTESLPMILDAKELDLDLDKPTAAQVKQAATKHVKPILFLTNYAHADQIKICSPQTLRDLAAAIESLDIATINKITTAFNIANASEYIDKIVKKLSVLQKDGKKYRKEKPELYDRFVESIAGFDLELFDKIINDETIIGRLKRIALKRILEVPVQEYTVHNALQDYYPKALGLLDPNNANEGPLLAEFKSRHFMLMDNNNLADWAANIPNEFDKLRAILWELTTVVQTMDAVAASAYLGKVSMNAAGLTFSGIIAKKDPAYIARVINVIADCNEHNLLLLFYVRDSNTNCLYTLLEQDFMKYRSQLCTLRTMYILIWLKVIERKRDPAEFAAVFKDLFRNNVANSTLQQCLQKNEFEKIKEIVWERYIFRSHLAAIFVEYAAKPEVTQQEKQYMQECKTAGAAIVGTNDYTDCKVNGVTAYDYIAAMVQSDDTAPRGLIPLTKTEPYRTAEVRRFATHTETWRYIAFCMDHICIDHKLTDADMEHALRIFNNDIVLHNININKLDNDGFNPLLQAIAANNAYVLKYLIKECDAKITPTNMLYALIELQNWSCLLVVADAFVKRNNGNIAEFLNDHIDLLFDKLSDLSDMCVNKLRWAVKHGLDLNKKLGDGENLLHNILRLGLTGHKNLTVIYCLQVCDAIAKVTEGAAATHKLAKSVDGKNIFEIALTKVSFQQRKTIEVHLEELRNAERNKSPDNVRLGMP